MTVSPGARFGQYQIARLSLPLVGVP